MNMPPDDFDERARAAGRALRQPAPPDGVRRIQTARRNRRVAQAGGALAVAVLGIGGIVALTRGGGDETIVTSEPTTVITTQPVPTTDGPPAPPTTSPAPPTTSPAVAPTTPEPSVATVPPEPIVPTVWVGGKLAGWYEGDEFVALQFGRELPRGVIGAELEVVDVDGAVHQATVTDEQCTAPYLVPAPSTWSLLASADAPVNGEPFDASPNPAELDAVLTTAGVNPAASRSVALPGTPTGLERLVLIDGWNTTFQTPTWIAAWDGAALTTIEGDPDASRALSLGNPIEAFYDLNGDGSLEVAFGVGDGWGVFEIATGGMLASGAAHPCPDPAFEPPPTAPTASAGIEPLLGEWAFDPDATEVSAATLWIEFDGTYTYARYAYCQDEVVDDGGLVSVAAQSTPECVPADADPRLRLLAEAFSTGAQLRVDAASGQLRIGTDEGVALTKVVPPAALDLSRGAAYGYYAGQYVARVDDLVASISEQLGQPSHDTGWFVTPPTEPPGEPDCLADMTTRAIWWGDFVVSLWPDESLTGGTIWNWTLGASAADYNVFADVPYTPSPSGITTVEGFGVGQPMSAIDEYYGDRFDGWNGEDVTQSAETTVPAATQFPNLFGNYAWLTATGGVLDTVSAQKTFC